MSVVGTSADADVANVGIFADAKIAEKGLTFGLTPKEI